jgi:hypothetical protein
MEPSRILFDEGFDRYYNKQGFIDCKELFILDYELKSFKKIFIFLEPAITERVFNVLVMPIKSS